jgi:hypothetical protein
VLSYDCIVEVFVFVASGTHATKNTVTCAKSNGVSHLSVAADSGMISSVMNRQKEISP